MQFSTQLSITFPLAASFAVMAALAPQGPPSGSPQTGAATPSRQAREAAGLRDVMDAGTRPALDVELSDEVPRPNREPGSPGAASDLTPNEASGNPFVLGFAAGDYAPPEGERIDPRLEAAVARLDNSRPERVAYGFVMFSKRITRTRLDELERHGVRLLGFHPHYAWKAAIPESALDTIAQLPFVRWVGCARPEQKLHPYLTKRLVEAPSQETHRVWITVFESDLGPDSIAEPVGTGHVRDADGSDRVVAARQSPVRVVRSRGWQQRALEARGVDVELFQPELNAFRARVKAAVIPELAGLDFVHSLEADMVNTHADGPSSSMVSADVARSWGFTGGFGALAGVIDSGLNVAHEAFTNKAYWGWDVSGNPDSPWIPTDFHGSMVTGGILADPPVFGFNTHIRGYAHKLGPAGNARIRVVENVNTPLSQAALFGFMQGNLDDGFGGISPPVHVFNNSYGSGAGSGPWKGTETDALAVDSAVWNANQVVVFAAHNYGPGPASVSIQGSAKNGLTVGNVPNFFSGADPGEIATDSGRGPTADGRWKPNVCAPGNGTLTCDEASVNGYVYGGGTSMAAPHVTGLVAQLADHYTWLRYKPARVASLLMATATTRFNIDLSTPGTSHHNTYGAGRIDAYRSHFLVDGSMATTNWEVNLGANQGSFGDFTIPAGVARVVVCLHWIEPPASALASKAVLNDLDLFIDAPPTVNTTLNSGEYSAQQSAVDNTEIRSIANPSPGTWRWKIFPYSAPVGSRASVTVHWIYGTTAPSGNLTLAPSKSYVKPSEPVQIKASLTTPLFIANGVYLDTFVTSGAALMSTWSLLKDGPAADLQQCLNSVPADQGLDVTMGSILHDDSRDVTYEARWNTEGVKTWAVQARSDNMAGVATSASVTVDGTAPSLVSSLGSSAHTPNVWSKNPNITYTWTPATDNLSGVDGYAIQDAPAETPPGFVKNLTATSSYSQALPPETPSWYLTIRTVDRSGNWSASYAKTGPYKIDAVPPSAPAGLVSTTHTVGAWSNNPVITMTWSPAGDALSGLQGYVVAFDQNPATNPVGNPTTTLTNHTTTLPFGSIAWYCHVRAVDNAGNLGPTAHAGPYSVDASAPTGAVSIDFDAAATTTGIVTLYLAFTDAVSSPKDVRFQNDGGSFSPWQPFQTVKTNWSLSANGGSTLTGTRTVTVEVRDNAGNVASASDTIFFHLPITYFGNSCPGSAGMPVFALNGLPGIGKPMTCQVVNTSAAQCYVGWGYSKTNLAGLPLPMDLGFLNSPGCQLYISFDGVVAQGAPGAFGFVVPNDPALAGQTFYLQAVLTGDPSGKPLIATNAAELSIAGP